MSKAHDTHGCTCPSGDGSLRWPCPVHPALLPCPFCGATARLKPSTRGDYTSIVCNSPCAGPLAIVVPNDQIEAGIAAWNARAPQAVAAQAAPAAVAVRAEWLGTVRAAHQIMRARAFDLPDSDAAKAAWEKQAGDLSDLLDGMLSATPEIPATEDSSAGDLATESVLIEGVAYTIPEPVALELLRLNIELQLAEVQAEPVALQMCSELKPRSESEKAAYLAGVADGRMYAERDANTAPQAQPVDALTRAAFDVLAERRRQVEAEGWTPELDDQYVHGDMASAAGCYAMFTQAYPKGDPHHSWPWDKAWWKPSKDARRNRVKACALLLAEIERFDRAAMAAAKKEMRPLTNARTTDPLQEREN